MKVTYKESLHDPDDNDPTTRLWHPVALDANGEGMITKPQGLLFMSPGINIDVSMPAMAESWKHGDLDDAEGLSKKDVWQKKRVMSDILNHLMATFTQEQQDQWRALNEFHERFKHSDEVQELPLVLRAGVCSCARTPSSYVSVCTERCLFLHVLH